MIRHSAAVHRGALENYLASEDIISLPSLPAEEWQRLRRRTGRAIAWRFCTLRNLVAYRGRFAGDAYGFAWGGIYRTLLVGPIVARAVERLLSPSRIPSEGHGRRAPMRHRRS